jgi:hypothetical protein
MDGDKSLTSQSLYALTGCEEWPMGMLAIELHPVDYVVGRAPSGPPMIALAVLEFVHILTRSTL